VVEEADVTTLVVLWVVDEVVEVVELTMVVL
jgi:hypothetical protein